MEDEVQVCVWTVLCTLKNSTDCNRLIGGRTMSIFSLGVVCVCVCVGGGGGRGGGGDVKKGGGQ